MSFIYSYQGSIRTQSLWEKQLTASTDHSHLIFKKWANPGLFYRLFSVFLNKHFYNKYMWIISIHDTVPGF